MKKFENLTEQAVFQPKKTVSVDTITQSFNVIRIYLTDSIDEIDSHMEQIEAIRSASEVDIIEIYTISNCGGYVNTIVPLCNALANTPAHTVCYVEGHCASAGTFPAMVVDEVRVGAYASFMLHCASGGAGHGTMVKVQNPLDFLRNSTVAFSKTFTTVSLAQKKLRCFTTDVKFI